MSDEREFDQEAARLVVNDRRRIDPVTGAVRPDAAGPSTGSPSSTGSPPPGAGFSGTDAGSAPSGAGPAPGSDGPGSVSEQDQIALLQMDLAERTHDLQRLQAEYANYRRRVDRDREAVRDQAVANVVLEMLPVLDDIGRAAEHGELVGGFKSVADALSGVLAKLGVEVFGEPGEVFDPVRHEALLHTYSDEVTETTAVQVFQPGYRLKERILRPARVSVADPTEALPAPAEPEPGPSGPDGADGAVDADAQLGPDADAGQHTDAAAGPRVVDL